MRERLDNGLTVIVVPTTGGGPVALSWVVHAGPRYEGRGLSHALEHMLFHGTTNYPSSLDYHRVIDGVGMDINASTARDALSVEMTTPASVWPQALAMLAEAVMRPRLDRLDLAVERNVISEEILSSLNENGEATDPEEITSRTRWPTHTMGSPIAGTLDQVESYEIDELRELHHMLFVGANSALVVTGPVDANKVLCHARTLFADLPTGRRQYLGYPLRSAQGLPVLVQDAGEGQVDILLTYEIDDRPVWELVPYALVGGFSAPLQQRIVEQSGLAYHLDVELASYVSAHSLDIEVSCAPAKVSEVILTIQDELGCIATHGLDQWQRPYAQLRRSYSNLDVEEMTKWHVESWVIGRDESYHDWHSKAMNATPADIRAAFAVCADAQPIIACVGQVRPRHISALNRHAMYHAGAYAAPRTAAKKLLTAE